MSGSDSTEPLWRHVVGARLRDLRRARAATINDIARRAGVSPQYLSEMERGRKEPSSEMLAAVAGALDTSLLDLTSAVAEGLRERATTGGNASSQVRAQFVLAA